MDTIKLLKIVGTTASVVGVILNAITGSISMRDTIIKEVAKEVAKKM